MSDDKVSVSLRETDDGQIVCSRSWNEGKEYKNEETVISPADMPEGMKGMFKKGPMSKPKKKMADDDDRIKEMAEAMGGKKKKGKTYADTGDYGDEDEKPKGLFGRVKK